MFGGEPKKCLPKESEDDPVPSSKLKLNPKQHKKGSLLSGRVVTPATVEKWKAELTTFCC